MTNRYFIIFEEGRTGFETLVDLLKSDLLLEGLSVYHTPSLTIQVLTGAPDWEDITSAAAFEWAGDMDLYMDVVIPPMFKEALAEKIQAWTDHYENGAPRPDGEMSLADEQSELRDDYQK